MCDAGSRGAGRTSRLRLCRPGRAAARSTGPAAHGGRAPPAATSAAGSQSSACRGARLAPWAAASSRRRSSVPWECRGRCGQPHAPLHDHPLRDFPHSARKGLGGVTAPPVATWRSAAVAHGARTSAFA